MPTSPAEVHGEPLQTTLFVLAAIAAPSSLHGLPVAAVVGQEAADMQVVLFIPHGNVRHETERKLLQLNQLITLTKTRKHSNFLLQTQRGVVLLFFFLIALVALIEDQS